MKFQSKSNLVRRMRKEQSIDLNNDDRSINKLEIRQEVIKDYAAIAEVNNLAFERENEAELIHNIIKSDRYIPELSLVVELDRKIVGHIMFSYIDLVAKETIKVLALAPVAVLPEYQHQGIGSLLVKTGLDIAKKMAVPMVIVLGDPKFYTRFGFEPAIKHNIQSPFDVADEAFMVKLLTNNSDRYRGKIEYPPAFYNV